ncbi:hypothetical protein B7P43_G14785 [Cryptotermes secundus]|uniref:Microtubule-associated protein 1A/B/S-like MBL-like domain-containing protein n=2 Tax=Cryptotermes secundus TaxID=105785 RepID=A0A2J7QIW5_9NEOP|nr:hypothetical protein B7P43_G14785 [Cryptotermes secundus]
MDEGQEIVLNLRHLQLRPHPCYRDGNHVEPVNLYHKVGHGKLDMYIISPAKDSRDVKEFLSKWNSNDTRLFVGRKDSASRDFHFPLQNLVSICALLVWQPANPNDTITRILFPGSTPQHKIFEGLDKLKHLEFLKHPVCTAKSASPSASTVGITSRASSKQRSAPAVIDKLLPGEGVKTASKTILSTMETNKEAVKTATIPVAGHIPDAKQIKPAATAAPISAPVPQPSKALPQTKQKIDKLTSKTEPPKMKTELNKSLDIEKISAKTEKATKMIITETTKSKTESRPKPELRASISKSKTDPKLPRSTERKNHKPPTEKKSESAKSSPTTPKKSVEGKMNGVASKAETAKFTRPLSRSRPSPTATPAKSTKEANNRKVVESKHASRMSSTSRGPTMKVKREQQEITASTKTERKPISRRPKPGSPSKAATSGKSPGSPAKSSSAKSTPTPSVKSDKDGVIRKVKGEADRITTDSSAVSTPSTVDPETAALKVKAAEVPEVTSTISETDKLRKDEEENIHIDKENEESLVKPEQGKSEEIYDNVQMAADEAGVDEIQIQDAAFSIEAQQEKCILPQDEKHEEESPVVEAEREQEGMEQDEETEDKESETAEEVQRAKQTEIEKDDIEATEEENTEDVEDEEEAEEKQHIEGRKSLADELEFEAKEHKEIKVEEDEEEEEDEYLIIEKEEVEQFMEDSLQDQESVESHVPEELEAMERRDEEGEEEDEEEEDEGELHKHLRDEVESEKDKKHEHDIIKVNGFHEEPKDVTAKEDKEYIKEGQHSPLVTELEEERDEKLKITPTDKKLAEKAEELKVTEMLNKEEESLTKQDAIETAPSTGQDEVAVSTDISTVSKEQLQEEVQGIITFAKEIVTKTKQENGTKQHGKEEVHMLKDETDRLEQVSTREKKDTEEGDEMKEASSASPEEKLDISSEKNREITDDTRDTDQKLDEEEGAEIKAADQRYPAEESQPDERFSTTVESAATTAPTLPEDERIPLDEIKEIVEEKYVKEETKEEKLAATSIVPTRFEQPTTLPQVVVAGGVGAFDPMAPSAVVHLERDIVKTPDEVADLPVHEEVDPGMYESDEFSKDFKGKNDTAKKQVSQHDLEDSRQQSPEFDIKEKIQLKYDDNIGKVTPFEDSQFVNQEKASFQAVDKDKLKETSETESKKTEKAEPEAPNIDFSADKDKIESNGKVYDLKEEKCTEFSKGIADEKETEAHVLIKQDVQTEDADKLLATTEAVSKADGVEDKKTVTDKVVPEQLPENVVKVDTEKEKVVEGPLEKGTDGSTLVNEEGLDDVVKQEVLDESKDTSKPVLETEEEKREQSASEFKPIAETSRGEGQMFDTKAEIKHITEEFIEKESCAVELETSQADKQHDQPSSSETTERESDKLELEDRTVEKTDLEKPVLEETKEEMALEDLAGETSESQTRELKDMDLNERRKELERLEKETVKTEQMKNSEEKDESGKTSPSTLSTGKIHEPEKQLIPDITSEESVIQMKPVQEKTDVPKAQFEEEKDFKKMVEDKSVTKESRSGMEDFITKPQELSEDYPVSGSSDHPEFEKHDVVKESEIHTKSSEIKQTVDPSEADIIEPEKVDLGGAETKTKEIAVVKEIILTKEGSESNEEKDIDEKDKASKDFSLKSDESEEDKTDISKLNTDAPKCIDAEVPNLTANEGLQDKPSPGALSMTYLEIIDKLQKDSQKADDSTIATVKESSPLTDLKQDASEGQSKGEVLAEQASNALSRNDNKTDEKSKTDITESVTKTDSSRVSDMKGIDSVQKTTEIKYDKTVEDSYNAVTKIEELDSDESAGGRPLITTGELKDLKEVTEFVPVIPEEEAVETRIESEYEKSYNKDVTETKSDQVSDVCKLKEPITSDLSQVTDEDGKDSIKGDTQKTVDGKTLEEVEKKKSNVSATDLQGELKLANDNKDDSYGDGSISPDEAYVDSGLEEEPVYRKLEAAELPEYVTVTPDSGPPSPKSQKDKKSSLKTAENALEQEPLAAVQTVDENTEITGPQDDTHKIDSITFQPDFDKAKHESPTDDLVSGKNGSTANIKEKTTDFGDDMSKKELEAVAARADMPSQIPATTAVPERQHGITETPSCDQPAEGLSSSDLKMEALCEANVLEDLVSASKSAIAEIEGKLSAQIEEILTAPRKESNQTISEIQESKSEISYDTTDKIQSSIDKDLTGTSQVLQEEVIRASEDKENAKPSPTHHTEAEETMLKSNEKVESESPLGLTEKDASEKAPEGSDRKQGPTEDMSSTELCNREGALTSHTANTSVIQEEISLDHDKEKNAILNEIHTISTPASVISKELPLSVISETDISKTMKKEVTDRTNVDQSAVSKSKETEVVITAISSSDPVCVTTSRISEIASAEGTAEKKTNVIIASSTVTVSDDTGTDKEISDSGNITSSVTVCRMVMTASSEDGGMETELCSGGSITAPTTSNTLSETSKQVIKEDSGKVTEDVSKRDISETMTTAGTTNGDMYIGDDSASDGEGSSKLVMRTTKELIQTGDIKHDERDDVEEFTTQEIGEDGKIITRTVKTTRTFVTAEGDESDDSDFEDEDNIESTAAEDGSDSSRMSKITTSLTTAVKRDDNGVRPLSTDSIDKTAGDVGSEVVTKTATSIITTLSGDEAGEVVTTTTVKEIILGDGSTPHDIIKDVDVLCKKEEVPQLDSTDSSKLADTSKESSPLKVTATDVTHCVPAQIDSAASAFSVAGGSEIEGNLTEAVGSKEAEQKEVNGKGSDTESTTVVSTTAVVKSVIGDLEKPSFVSAKNEAQTGSSEPTCCAIPGLDADSDLDAGCGPSSPHSGISSGMMSRGTKNMTGSCEGHSDSRHYDSDEDDDDEPGSPLSVTSQLPPSPPSNFYFEMSDRVTPDYEAMHFIPSSIKHKEEVPSSMTSSLYGSFPPEPFQEFDEEQRKTEEHFSSSSVDETPMKYSGTVLSEDSVMTGSFYGSLREDKKAAESHGVHDSVKRLQEDDTLDFEQAKYEHRAARGKDLTSSGSSYNNENISSPTHATKKYEYQYMSGLNGQKLKDDNSFHELTQDYGNANVAAGKQYEDLMNQNRDIMGQTGSSSHQGPHHKETEHISTDILKDKKETSSVASGISAEHDPIFRHQFSAPTTSASSFAEPPQGFTQSSGAKEDNKKDPIADWGKPLGLPAPTPPPTNNGNTAGEDLPSTPKREKKVMQIKKTMNESNRTASGKDGKSKRPDSPMKRPISERKLSSNKEGGRNVGGMKSSGSPIYINLTYVPHHGNSYYTTLEFFKKVRARYYVFSGTEPSREVYNALLDAKQTWEDKELEVTIIPTYDTDTLGYWVAENEDALAMHKIDLSPSASRCTINLQDHETSCSAYRLEF